ncbi:porin family protein [Ursidibacter sp. B-7004-1]
MKKLALATLVSLVSVSAFAAPVGQTFTGFGAGIDLTSTKYEDAKRATGVGIIADYGIDYGNNFVGVIEGKVKFNSSKLVDVTEVDGSYTKVDEKWRASVSYLQGYRVSADFLPYVKVGYVATKFEAKDREVGFNGGVDYLSASETRTGLGFGIGAKYAVSSNFEVGAEYLRTNIKFDDERVKGNTFGANATYRF